MEPVGTASTQDALPEITGFAAWEKTFGALRARRPSLEVSSTGLVSMPLHAPGHSNGLLDIPRWGFLLNLLVKKELRVRYRGSALGMVWSYVKPAVQLVVYFVAMGQFLGSTGG